MGLRAPLRLETKEKDAALSIRDFESRGFAFDSFGMEDITACERADIRGIRRQDSAAETWLGIEDGTALEHDYGIAGQAPQAREI